MKKKNNFYRDEIGEETSRIFFHFLENFDPNKVFNCSKYFEIDFKTQIQLMSRFNYSTIYIDFENIIQYSDELADIIEEQFYRIESYISEAFYEFLNENFFFSHGIELHFNKKFWIGFYNLPKINSLKKLNSEFVNKLACVSGVVTRISEAYPEIFYASFKCANNNCGFNFNFVEQEMVYKEPKICPKCLNITNWTLLFEDSIFIFLQKIRIQQIGRDDCYSSKIPRTLDIILRDDNIDCLKLGDKCFFTGSIMVLPFNKNLDLFEKNFFSAEPSFYSKNNFFNSILDKTYFKIYFLVNHIFSFDFKTKRHFLAKKNYSKFFSRQIFFSQQEKEKILKIRLKKNLFKTLISPIAPSLKNIESIKIGILLLFVGGIRKKTEENINIRGNLNVCFIFDDIFNKNLLFKSINFFLPRISFINGNGYVGKNISASIIKDNETNEFFIEAGALILSNQGFCLIDNFDDLKYQNQVPINEAMEQQTVSIAKGNIKTTLKVQTSLIAFIDIQKKKYDKTKSFQKNSGLNHSIFSRFDLFYLISNSSFKKDDEIISENIVLLNRKNKKNFFQNIQLTSIIQLYLSFACLLKPIIKNKSGLLIIRVYKFMRKCQFLENSKNNFFTIRQIESLIRLSEGFSKLYLGLYVKKFHVKAASRLLFNSFYPFNKSSEKLFRPDSKKNNNFFKGKKAQNVIYKKKNAIKISFFEFRIVFRNIIAEIKYLENKGFCGLKLKFLLKRLMKNSYFGFSYGKKIYNITKIILVIRFMIFSYHNLIIIKCLSDNKKSKFIKLIYLKEKIQKLKRIEQDSNL